MKKLQNNIEQLRLNIRKQIPAIRDLIETNRDLIETNKELVKLYEKTGKEEILNISSEIGKVTNSLLYQQNELFHCYEKFCLLTY